ncbi:MAG TPA: ATP synthase F1 subunit delta [Thermodesulfobacteriota bacterium]|nr:ATP synthase F1 subunit delta [Thermodesulfobacteriota bacterium]
MPRISSGKRYAQAAFELALEKNELESWRAGLKKMAELTGNEELMALLQNPRLPFAAKRSLLQKGLGEINPPAFNLALLLESKGRLKLANDISQQYNELLDFHRGIEHAEVIAAMPLIDEDREAISRRLGEIVEHKVVIDAQVDPSIIGGFIARIGDMLIDGSIRQRLESLKKCLIEVRG